MRSRLPWAQIAVGGMLAGVLLVPYLAAIQLAPPGGEFTGFLVNPLDGFSYLAKMRQGLAGDWLFHLPYTEAQGAPALLFPYHLLLGHVARILGLPLIQIYHAARLGGAAAMLLAARFLFGRLPLAPAGRTAAFVLTLLGSGWGWILIGRGEVTPDLSMPEAFPWYSAYANAHFALAWAALLIGGAAFVQPLKTRLASLGLGVACGTVLGAVAGYAALPAGVAMGVWLYVFRRHESGAAARARLPVWLGWVGASAPWLVYDYGLSRSHPVLSLWFAQNQTPSPALPSYVIAYAPMLLLVAAGIWLRRKDRAPAIWFLIFWAVITAASLYAPFSLQRRFALGLFVPIAGLAGWGLERMSQARRRLLLSGAIASGLPSIALVVGAGLGGVVSGQTGLVMDVETREAMQWLGEHAPPNSVVLTGPETGNALPAFAMVRVLYGHPFETPRAPTKRQLVLAFLRGDMDLGAGLEQIEGGRIDLVFYGPEERLLGSPTWLADLPPIFENESVIIYRVPTP